MKITATLEDGETITLEQEPAIPQKFIRIGKRGYDAAPERRNRRNV